MKKILPIVMLLAMAVWAVFNFVKQDSSAEEKDVGLQIGNLAPDFELQTLAGETVRLSDFRGEPVLLNFWATWCGPCRSEMPDMQRFHEDTGAAVLAINLTDTETNTQNVPDFQKEYALTFPILLDEDGKVSKRYEIRPIPTTYIIDSDGIIQFFVFGPLNYEQMKLEFDKLE
ncbi:TlpA disulfide reductase family protein [Gracilibacillus salinarum]|uniref:TlpA family protein disulfide reductase n=1 Tax=Gracilibacillus salinarum TaxID=2932255 RepID=A0ABY4GSD4_9BACI|nr:TlpA disulfide reductase family protein [Gracilibacillus salinarum]UOQ87189.1 TlpA family protein disulfide reductase [Gracilibacillus salinarum]